MSDDRAPQPRPEFAATSLPTQVHLPVTSATTTWPVPVSSTPFVRIQTHQACLHLALGSDQTALPQPFPNHDSYQSSGPDRFLSSCGSAGGTGTGQTLRASARGYFFLRVVGRWFVGLRLAPIALACW